MPTEELKASADQYLMGTYARQPISIEGAGDEGL